MTLTCGYSQLHLVEVWQSMRVAQSVTQAWVVI